MSEDKFWWKYNFDITHALGKRLRKVFERDGFDANGAEDYIVRAVMEASPWICEYCHKTNVYTSRACGHCGKLPSDTVTP